MSNLEGARAYETIVESVINEVREDFESAGIDEQTLQDLRLVWQTKLSDSRVAKFMWDPEDDDALNSQLHNAHIAPSLMESQGLAMPALSPGDDNKSGLTPQQQSLMTQTKHDQQPKDEIELTMGDSDGQIAEQLKLQAKQARKSALLETDEINSDLDDSEDDYLNSSGDDEGQDENIVLCLYEKVLRVKNKWKCNLKDGLATINHKDYAFQKAQGETEW
ncbi:LANO_0H13982g1_1 [Lachancea nothofagi CBS 11611]|uniref:Transcription initiation factor IIA large subunit n=1 Tax=Lachancea nothofagi CBS 11611 TaxID=1266666 RepID=A0A1G4KMD8_9SACH|nr:LANO_0H13982g1_1 [Lachancea nothofagi CBS 11611]